MSDRPYFDLDGPMAPQSRFKPVVGRNMTIDVVGERVLAKVLAVLPDGKAARVEILGQPVGRGSQLRKGQQIIATPDIAPLTNAPIWRMLDEHEIRAIETADRQEREAKARYEREERERVALLEAERRAEESARAMPDEPIIPAPPYKRPVLGPRRTKRKQENQ